MILRGGVLPRMPHTPHPGLQRVQSHGPECCHMPTGTKKACVFSWPIMLALEQESFMVEKTLVGMRGGSQALPTAPL